MNITLSKQQIEAIGVEALAPYGGTEDALRWGRSLDVDLSDMTRAKVKAFRSVLSAVPPSVRGISARLAEVDRWIRFLEERGQGAVCVKKIADFAPMLKQYLKAAPKHWIYQRRPDSEEYQPYYVSNIIYTPPRRRDGWTVPAYVTVHLHWEELGQFESSTDVYRHEEVADKTVPQILAEAGYVVESPALLESYRANVARYVEIHNKVGLQFNAVGVGETEHKEREYWYQRASSRIRLDRDGIPSRVVVDVLSESDKAVEKNKNKPSTIFWSREACDHEGSDEDDDTDLRPGEEDEDDGKTETADIPLAPSLMCFDLRRHCRVKIYVDQLTLYDYQTDLSEKLVLPAELTRLVTMLVGHRGGFRDIVGNKGGGAVILCAGKPGTGKTLTAEVYSEAMKRPLYSVQCSQLGTDPDDLEKELLKVFARASRWNAILLLDEADVYVAARGSDLVQNAIVGVFLRTLEYYAGVLFLTTNRADLVDDAVASRCLARIDYAIPTPHDQARIWRTLADTAGIPISDAEIKRIVLKFPSLSGRDVKNLLKLSSMVVAADGGKITADVVQFVKRFKPTED